ncbi:unnamed protein product [Symbiodinium microadriaticum]|nr:unnamed protein product [Symbiodinium microadriaticum]
MNQGWRCKFCKIFSRATANYCGTCGKSWQQAWEKPQAEPGWTYTGEPKSPRKRSPRPRRKGTGKQGAATQQPAQPKGTAKGGQGTGDGGPSAPDLSQLPVMPATRVPAPPKPTTEGPASDDKKVLDSLMMQLTAPRVTLTPEVEALVSQYRSESVKLHGKQLHQLVARQTQARRELSKLNNDKQVFEKTWCDYLAKLVSLVQSQIEGRQKTLEAFAASEEGWTKQLNDATHQLAQSTGGGRSSADSTAAMEEEDDLVDQEIEQEAARKQAQAATAAELQNLLQTLQSVQQDAATAVKRDGSRTPRRRKSEALNVDSSPELEPGDTDGLKPRLPASATGDKSAPKWRHSVTVEKDFVSIWTAQLLALQCNMEVETDGDHGLYGLLLDPRVADAAQEQATFSETDTASVSDSQGWQPALFSTFQAPLCNMVRARVELDEVGDGRQAIAAVRDAALCSLNTVSSQTVQNSVISAVSFYRTVRFAKDPESYNFTPGDRLAPAPSLHRDGRTKPRQSCLRSSKVTQAFPLPVDAQSQQVRPVASTAPDPLFPTEGTSTRPTTGARGSSLPGLVDLRIQLASRVALFPAELDRPEMRGQQISQFWWFSGYRASGSVGDTPQQDRYALFTTASHVEVRNMRRGLTLEALVAEIFSVVPGLRSLRILLERLEGLPAVQIIAATREDPQLSCVTPVDLRGVGGRVCTLPLQPGATANMVSQEIASGCPPARRPQVPFRLFLPDGRAFVAIPYQVPGPDFIRGRTPPAPELVDAQEQAEELQEEDQIALLQTGSVCSPSSKGLATATSVNLPIALPLLEVGDRIHCPVALPRGDPPTLLKTEGPPRASVVHSTNKVPTILPERLAAPSLREIPAGQLCIYCQTAAHHNELRKFSIFDRHRHRTVRKASVHWSLLDYIVDATSSASEETQCVQVLTLPIADLPEPQLTITPIGLPPGVLVLPLDARSIGGPLCALPMQPGSDAQQVFEVLARLAPATASTVEHVLRLDGVFLQDPTGRIWETLPIDLSEVQWLKVVLEPRVQLQLDWLMTQGGPTTLTSTAVLTAQHTSGQTETVSFVLAGGGTVIRLAPQPIRTASVRQSLCELLFILGLQGRVPHRPVVSLASAAPRQAAQPANRIVIFLVYPATDIGVMCHILQDYSLDGSLLQEMSVDCDVVAGHLISEAHRRRGYQASLNGIPHTASDRTLITGDLIQVEQAPPSARVTPIDALYDILPDLRFFSMPLRVPSLQQLMRDPAAGIGRQEIIREAMQRTLDNRILERRVEIGEPGHNCHAILVLGPEHPPLLLYMPSNVEPSLAEATTFLAWSGFFEPGTTFVDPQVYAHTFPVFVSVPKGSQRATILFPAPHTLLHWLQLNVPLGTPLQGFGLPVRRNFELVLPARTTHGAVIRERLIRGSASTAEATSTSLLQVKVQISRPQPASVDQATLVPPLCQQPPPLIPTPLGRRTLHVMSSAVGCNSLSQGPTGAEAPPRAEQPMATRRQIVLADLVAEPVAAVTWGVNADICEACFADHVLPGFTQQAPPLCTLGHAALRHWSCLPAWNPSQLCDELFMFTDGSYFPGSPFASWAVVIIARQGDHIGRVGLRAGVARGPMHGGSKVRPELSAFDGELEAALHALAIAAAIPCPLVQVGVDCAAAIDVIQGQVALKPQDAVAHAAVAIRALLMMQGKTVLVHKVLAHAGCALNGLADAAAKSVLKQEHAPTEDFSSFWMAVSEGVVAKLWLVPSHPLTACTLPHLSGSGTWSQAHCAVKRQTPLDSIFGTHPKEAPTQRVDLHLRILQYNALSLRGAGATDLIARGLAKHRVDIAGLQETRLKTEGITTIDDFWVLHSPCTPQGHGGAQIWVKRSKHWDRQAFAILHREPQVLVALGVFQGVRVLLVSAHALPACSPDADIQEWWGHYDTILHKSPANCVPIFMMDANATFAGGAEIADTHQCRPTCGNSSRLLAFACRRGLGLSPQQTPTGKQLFSWTSPNGHRKLIDYVAWPQEWAAHGTVHPGVLLGDLHEDIDHQPVCLDLHATLAAPRQVTRNGLDTRMWQNPAAATTAAAAALACPPIPWTADSTAHVDCIHRHLFSCMKGAEIHCPSAPRNPALTEPTLELVRAHRHLRRCSNHALRLADRAYLQLCLHAWRSRADTDHNLCLRDQKYRRLAAGAWARQYRHAKRMRAAMWHDKAEFTRRGIEQCRGAGPAVFAHKLRAILRTGRRYRAPALLPSLTGEAGRPVTKEDVADSFGKYFAIAERAEPLPLTELVQTSQSNGPTPCFDGDALPTLSHLASGFAGLQKGRAPGLSGLPSEVFRSNPMVLAIHYFPVVCKLFLRDPSPVQWRGGLSISVPKPGKPGDLHQGYRAIMLLESDNKAVQKAVRPQLLEALPCLGTPDQMGGRPGFTLNLPAACVKAHLANLRRTKASGAVIFIDSASAYYSIAKEFLALTKEQKQNEDLLRARAQALFDDQSLQDEFIDILRSSADAVSEALTPALQTFLQKQLNQTWYISRVDTTEAYVARSGTAPGAPLADVMFSLIFGRLLSRMSSFLAESGLQATIASGKGPGYTPTWADDVSILLRTEVAADVPGAVAQVIGLFADELQRAGLRANHGAGKTEALLSLNGHGSRQVRREVFCSECPQIPFSTARNKGYIRVTPAYDYLGSTVQADGFSLPDVQHRLKLAREMFRPVKNRLLRNPCLTRQEKLTVVKSRILTRFLYGSGLWSVRTHKEEEAISEAIFGFYRGAFRPILGFSSQGYTNVELASALELPLPDELLHVERVRAAGQLAAGGLTAILEELEHDEGWWPLVLKALQAIGLPTGDKAGLVEAYITKGIEARRMRPEDLCPRPPCDEAGWAICQDQGREAWNLTKDWELFEPPLLPSELPTETPNQASP